MLVEHVTETQDAGLLESVLIPFDLYNDSAQHALTCLKQRFLYDEIEAEVSNYRCRRVLNCNIKFPIIPFPYHYSSFCFID